MNVFFTASRWGKGKYQEHYDLVRETIKAFNVVLISPEENNYHLLLSNEERKQFPDSERLRRNWNWHYETIRRGIHWADAVVFEVSQEDFQLGHEATLAILEKKPVLCLSINDDFSKKIHHDYFFAAIYSKKNVKPIMQDFFARVRDLRLARRFNMFLYPSQVDYVEKIGKKHGMNMSEYIRHLINIDRRANS